MMTGDVALRLFGIVPAEFRMTLRGYSAVLERTESPTSSVARDEARVPPPTSPDPEANLSLRERDRPTRPQRPLGAGLALQPSNLASRQALSVATKTTSTIDQQLALIEMLIAVGPEVREQGALDEALRALERMEEQFRGSVAQLLRACSDLGFSG
jgi:hypothetical protein